MNALVKHQAQPSAVAIPALSMNEDELIGVLQSSVYPGAKLESIKLVVNVCKASQKDPLKKPYHIVPMQVSTGKKDGNGWDIKDWRDVIMPGINDYRTDAARTGQHAGTTEPEFGPDVTETLGEVQITYPAWCRVTVKRLMPHGVVVEFSAVERWKENYATKSAKTDAPNAMWKRRPYAQLAKCAEAQALRKAFPEVGNQPTADEMEGKEIEINPTFTESSREPERKPEAKQQASGKPDYPADRFAKMFPKFKAGIEKGETTAQDACDFIDSKGYAPTADQLAALDSVKPPIPGESSSVPGVTYAAVAAKLHAAKTMDALDEIADLIGEIPDADQRKELGDLYNVRRIELEGN